MECYPIQHADVALPSYHRTYRDGSFRQIFLSELLPVLASFIDSLSSARWILSQYCLVCWEWNQLFTPLLYESITLADARVTSLLCRTLWPLRPSLRTFIKEINLSCDDQPNQSMWLIILTQLPNLRKGTIEWFHFNASRLHPTYIRNLKLLPPSCEMRWRLGRYHCSLLLLMFKCIGRLQPTSFDCQLTFESLRSEPLYVTVRTKSRIGKCEAEIGTTIADVAALHSLNQCLAVMGHLDFRYNTNLRYLKLEMRPSTILKIVLPANGAVFTDIAEVLRNWIHLTCSTLATDSLALVLHHLPFDRNTGPIIEDSLLDLATSDRITDLIIRLDGFLVSHFPRLYGTGCVISDFSYRNMGDEQELSEKVVRWLDDGGRLEEVTYGRTMHIFGYCSCPEIIQTQA